MIVYVLLVHKHLFQEKSLCYFHKKLKIKKTQKYPKSPFFVVFLGGFFWVGFFGGFFIANPALGPTGHCGRSVLGMFVTRWKSS